MGGSLAGIWGSRVWTTMLYCSHRPALEFVGQWERQLYKNLLWCALYSNSIIRHICCQRNRKDIIKSVWGRGARLKRGGLYQWGLERWLRVTQGKKRKCIPRKGTKPLSSMDARKDKLCHLCGLPSIGSLVSILFYFVMEKCIQSKIYHFNHS